MKTINDLTPNQLCKLISILYCKRNIKIRLILKNQYETWVFFNKSKTFIINTQWEPLIVDIIKRSQQVPHKLKNIFAYINQLYLFLDPINYKHWIPDINQLNESQLEHIISVVSKCNYIIKHKKISNNFLIIKAVYGQINSYSTTIIIKHNFDIEFVNHNAVNDIYPLNLKKYFDLVYKYASVKTYENHT